MLPSINIDMQCKQCKNLITSRAARIFCSQSCSAVHNNQHRSKASRLKQSISLKKYQKENPRTIKAPTLNTCKMCNEQFTVTYKTKRRKFCSPKCYTKFNSNRAINNPMFGGNKSKNIIEYTTKAGSVVKLDSSWEYKLASVLDMHNIEWTRPDYLKYTDDNKQRRYFPDFFLQKQNMFIDTKNPWRCKEDMKKLVAVVNQNDIKLLIISDKKLITIESIQQPFNGLLII